MPERNRGRRKKYGGGGSGKGKELTERRPEERRGAVGRGKGEKG